MGCKDRKEISSGGTDDSIFLGLNTHTCRVTEGAWDAVISEKEFISYG